LKGGDPDDDQSRNNRGTHRGEERLSQESEDLCRRTPLQWFRDGRPEGLGQELGEGLEQRRALILLVKFTGGHVCVSARSYKNEENIII